MITKKAVKRALSAWFCPCIPGHKLRFDTKDKTSCYPAAKELVLNK